MANETGIEEALCGEKMIFVGIDPGVTGAVAFLSETSRILYATAVPTLTLTKSRRQIDGVELTRQLLTLREPGIETFITIEDVHAFPGQGVTSMFSFGKSFGQILGIIEALGLRYQLVLPTRWQKLLFSGTAGEPKTRSRLAAHRLWPSNTSKHDGITDALLLAEYGRRTWAGKNT